MENNCLKVVLTPSQEVVDDNNNNDVVSSVNTTEVYQEIGRDCIQCDCNDCMIMNPQHRCGRCFCAFYCSKVCQKRDWRNHKKQCVSIITARDTVDKEHTAMQTFLGNKQNISISQAKISKKHTSSDDICGICLEKPMSAPIMLNECHHEFCTLCLLKWQRHCSLTAHAVRLRSIWDEVTLPVDDPYRTTCPICRTETVQDVYLNVIESAVESHAKALLETNKSSKMLRDSLLKEAMYYIDQVLAAESPDICLYLSKAEILLELDLANEALKVISMLIAVNKEREKHPVCELLKEEKEAMANRNTSRVQELRAAIISTILIYGPPPSLLKPDDQCAIYYLKIRAYENMNLYNVALLMYSSFGSFYNDSLFDKEQKFFRKFIVYRGKGRCYYELKAYKDCILATNVAIAIDRLEPQVHYYKALAQQKLNRLDDAIVTMKQAILYEAPWNIENKKKYLAS